MAVAQGKRTRRKVKTVVAKPKKAGNENVRVGGVGGVRGLEVMGEWVEEREEEGVNMLSGKPQGLLGAGDWGLGVWLGV